MRKIWLALAALSALGTAWIATPARAEVPQIAADDRVLGDAKAPITIFEFFSLTCPHCAEFSEHTFPKLKAEWIDTGKAKLVYRDYPLDRNALKAAMIARCAPPERYPGFVETLFAQQNNWGVLEDPVPALRRIALLGGMNGVEFDKCVNDDALSKSIVASEYDAQKKYGVESTPTFFINGKKLVGALPYDEFAKELGKATAAIDTPVKMAGAPTRSVQP
jgi:protein-disulfide isomerase